MPGGYNESEWADFRKTKIFEAALERDWQSGEKRMKKFLKGLLGSRSAKSGNGTTLGYQIPQTVWMSDLKKAAEYGALLAEKAGKLRTRALGPERAALVSGS
jgi:hypothetical protein